MFVLSHVVSISLTLASLLFGGITTVSENNRCNLTTIREIAADGSIPIAFYKFERDAIGRIKHEVRAPRSPAFHTSTQNASFDADDRLATFNGQNVSNDADDNMTHAPVSATDWKNFQYDSRNRLTAVGTPQEWQNIYDAEGIRVEYRNAGVPTKFVVSPGTLPKTLVQINDDGTRRYFVHGLGLLYHIDDEETASPVTTTYHFNSQGSTIALSDDSGSAIGRFHFDPYGMVQRKEGITDTIFQFNGHYGIATDPTGLVHLNARFYNPYLKRFMNSDPAGFAGGMNWFAYSAGDPVNLMDPLGLGPADSERYTWMDGVQDGIGVGGFFPGLGAIPDGVNGVIYLFRGKWGDSMFSFGAMVPLAGDLVAAGKYADSLNDVRRIADGAGGGNELVDLASTARRNHILDGEVRPNGLYGGGHRPGTGFPNKSEFPNGWSDDQIMHHISDVATDPGSMTRSGRGGDVFAVGTRNGVEIEVLIRNGEIWTGYPTNVMRNPR